MVKYEIPYLLSLLREIGGDDPHHNPSDFVIIPHEYSIRNKCFHLFFKIPLPTYLIVTSLSARLLPAGKCNGRDRPALNHCLSGALITIDLILTLDWRLRDTHLIFSLPGTRNDLTPLSQGLAR